MSNESGCKDARYAFLFVLAVLALVIWLVVRFTGQIRVTATEPS